MGGVARGKSGRAKSLRMGIRRLNSKVRGVGGSLAIDRLFGICYERSGPFPWHSVLRLMADESCHEAIRGDGTRRRACELRNGLRAYGDWLHPENQEPEEIYEPPSPLTTPWSVFIARYGHIDDEVDGTDKPRLVRRSDV